MSENNKPISIYVSEDMKADLDEEARLGRRSVNQYILYILERRDQIEEIQRQITENNK